MKFLDFSIHRQASYSHLYLILPRQAMVHERMARQAFPNSHQERVYIVLVAEMCWKVGGVYSNMFTNF
jgi:hypothetical protein